MCSLVVTMAAWERGRKRERKKESKKAWWKLWWEHCNAEISQVICANYWQFPRHRLEALSRTLARVKAEKATEISQLEQGKLKRILSISFCTLMLSFTPNFCSYSFDGGWTKKSKTLYTTSKSIIFSSSDMLHDLFAWLDRYLSLTIMLPHAMIFNNGSSWQKFICNVSMVIFFQSVIQMMQMKFCQLQWKAKIHCWI